MGQSVRFRERIRRRASGLFADGFFEGLSRVGRLHPAARAAAHGVQVVRDLSYLPSSLEEHRLDLYIPTQHPGPWPVILYVHGGGFRILSKDTHWLMALRFARRGFLVCNVSYRLAPRHPFPAAVTDVCAAYTWLARNAARYGGDLSRLALAGESAGGNLVTGLALAASYRRSEPWARAVWDTGVVPRAVIAACAFLQVSGAERFHVRRPDFPRWISDIILGMADDYLGRATILEDDPARDFADPLLHLERSAPPDRPLPAFFAPVGTRDPLLDDTRRLAAALERLGATCVARYYPGEVHAFHAIPFRAQARLCWRETFAFLGAYLSAKEAAEQIL